MYRYRVGVVFVLARNRRSPPSSSFPIDFLRLFIVISIVAMTRYDNDCFIDPTLRLIVSIRMRWCRCVRRLEASSSSDRSFDRSRISMISIFLDRHIVIVFFFLLRTRSTPVLCSVILPTCRVWYVLIPSTHPLALPSYGASEYRY